MIGPSDDGRLAAYLLGRLSPEEEERLELEYFRGADAYERLLAAEDDLIDEYAAGRLEPEDVRRFEQLFLAAPGRRERVDFAVALRRAAAPARRPPAPRRRSVLLPLAAVLPVALAGGWWLTVRDLRTELAHERERQSARERETADQRARIASLEDALARGAATSGVASGRLSPGYERDATQPATVTVPAEATAVRLHLALGPAARAGPFVARLETAEGRTVATLHELRPRDAGEPVVDMVVPAASLAPGTYVVILEAGRPLEPVDTYHFRVAAP